VGKLWKFVEAGEVLRGRSLIRILAHFYGGFWKQFTLKILA
jgi:hypothetical protein